MNEELKPCPFCGNGAHLCEIPILADTAIGVRVATTKYRAECDNYCVAQVNFYGEPEAVEAWNKRHE